MIGFILFFLCLKKTEAGLHTGEAEASPTQKTGATPTELKGIESYYGHAALLLSSSTYELA